MRKPNTSKDNMKKEGNTPCSYFLIKNGAVVGSFPSFYEAYQQGLNQFMLNKFLVKKSGE